MVWALVLIGAWACFIPADSSPGNVQAFSSSRALASMPDALRSALPQPGPRAGTAAPRIAAGFAVFRKTVPYADAAALSLPRPGGGPSQPVRDAHA